MPIFKLFEGRPKRVFFSGAAAFLGGILFFRCPKEGGVDEKDLWEEQKIEDDKDDDGGKSTEERAWRAPTLAGKTDILILSIPIHVKVIPECRR